MAKKNKKANYVTLNAASKILNVSVETLRNWDNQGKLKAKRNPINQYRIYDLNKLQSFAENSEVNEPVVTYKTLFDDGSSLKTAIKHMSKAFRDSEGGSLLDRFEEISKLLFCKLYDEEVNDGRGFSFIDTKQPVEKIFLRVEHLFKAAIKAYPNVFVNGRGELSSDTKAIAQVALILKNYELKTINTDIKGKIYEELIKNTLDKNENQQFFTPRNIVQFIVELINPSQNCKICDPACGSGGFLISYLEEIKKKYPSLNISNYSKNHLKGIEVDSRMVWVSQMNLILHGGHHDSILYMKGSGSLSFDKEGMEKLTPNRFDIIITNPPFGSDFDNLSDLKNFELGRGKKSRRRGILFIEKCLHLLKEGGKIAIILEESILNNPSNEDVRAFIDCYMNIEAIISLPETTFMPYATVKTSVLVATKLRKASKKSHHILMCNIENVGFTPNGEVLFSDERDETGKLKILSDLPECLKTIKEFNKNGHLPNRNEKYFTVNLETEQIKQRLDTLFYHPSKKIAYELLAKASYPISTIGQLVTVLNKVVVPQFEFPDEIIRYIGLANISPFDGTYFVSEILGEKLKSAVKLFEPNTVIFSKMRPELRKVIFIPSKGESGFVSSECFVFKTTHKILPQYLALLLRSDLVFGQIIFQVTGLGRPRIGRSELLSVKIPVPPIEKQDELIKLHTIYESNRNALIEKSRLLQQEADHLIKKSFEEIEASLCH